MPQPICVPCRREMKTSRIGVEVQVNTESGRPYYKVSADEKKCPGCGATVLSGYGEATWHYEPGFAARPVEMEVV